MDYSFMEDNLPFSMDGMEKAKKRSQTEQICEPEAKLKKISAPNHQRKGNEKNPPRETEKKKIMTPEERFLAHNQQKY